jgi:hypothetical protein
MRPEANSNQLFAAVRARAKMHEFRAAAADFNVMRREPSSLLALAIGILGDAAAALADRFISRLLKTVAQKPGRRTTAPSQTWSASRPGISTPFSRHS